MADEAQKRRIEEASNIQRELSELRREFDRKSAELREKRREALKGCTHQYADGTSARWSGYHNERGCHICD